MNEAQFMLMTSPVIAQSFTSEGIETSDINWPNLKLDHEKSDVYYEVDYIFYPSVKINLSSGRRITGCIAIKSFDKLNVGVGNSIALLKNVADKIVSHTYAEFLEFSSPDLRILGNTLSLTQTTTDIPRSQIQYIIDFTFIG